MLIWILNQYNKLGIKHNWWRPMIGVCTPKFLVMWPLSLFSHQSNCCTCAGPCSTFQPSCGKRWRKSAPVRPWGVDCTIWVGLFLRETQMCPLGWCDASSTTCPVLHMLSVYVLATVVPHKRDIVRQLHHSCTTPLPWICVLLGQWDLSNLHHMSGGN
jgi:hypothetical protein